MKEPFAPLTSVLADRRPGAIVDRDVVEKNGGLANWDGGSGPFKLGRVHPRRARSCWSGTATTGRPASRYLDQIEFRVITDESARLAAIRSGEVDMVDPEGSRRSPDWCKRRPEHPAAGGAELLAPGQPVQLGASSQLTTSEGPPGDQLRDRPPGDHQHRPAGRRRPDRRDPARTTRSGRLPITEENMPVLRPRSRQGAGADEGGRCRRVQGEDPRQPQLRDRHRRRPRCSRPSSRRSTSSSRSCRRRTPPSSRPSAKATST